MLSAIGQTYCHSHNASTMAKGNSGNQLFFYIQNNTPCQQFADTRAFLASQGLKGPVLAKLLRRKIPYKYFFFKGIIASNHTFGVKLQKWLNHTSIQNIQPHIA